MASAQIVYFLNEEEPRFINIFGDVVIGRGEKENLTEGRLDLPLDFLAEEQSRITYEEGNWYYTKLTEEGFTSSGGKVLQTGEKIALTDMSVIRIANDQLLTILFCANAATAVEWKSIMLDGDTGHMVRVVDATDLNKPAEEQDYIILQYEDRHWTISESNTHSNLSIGGMPIQAPRKIRMDDVITVGDTTFFFDGSRLVYSQPVGGKSLSILIDERVVYSKLKKQVLLRDIDLQIDPGNMVLILGGSGAGKSTFVNAVTGYEKAKATVKSGNVDFYKDYDKVKYQIGFVPQSDLLRYEDSVMATLSNAADLRLPASMPEEEKTRRVKEVLDMFGLLEFASDKVSKLSGGQRKRLSICVEYISDPSLFILDEPDSGLDGVMARELMERLKAIAQKGKIVMVITHQPDRATDLFDKVIVLAKGGEDRVGQLAFYGSVPECREFFGAQTMEDVVKSVNAVSEGGLGRADYFIEKYQERTEEQEKERAWEHLMAANKAEEVAGGKQTAEQPNVVTKQTVEEEKHTRRVHYTGRLGQMWVYHGKLFRLFWFERNWKSLIMAGVIAWLVGAVVGVRMFQSMEGATTGALAFVCVSVWNGFFNSIQSVCKERDIIKREHRTGMHITSYLGAHIIYQAILCFLQVVISLAIYLQMGMKFPEHGVMVPGNSVVDVGITLFLITFAADMLALMVSCIVRTTTVAMTIVPFLLIIQMLFAGVAFPLDKTMDKVAMAAVSRWGINALCAQADFNSLPSNAVWNKLYSQRNIDGVDMVVDYMMDNKLVDDFRYKTAESAITPKYEATRSNVGMNWAVLAGFAVLYVIIGGIALENIDKDKR